ncbi:MAG: hypothetical protein LBC58_07095 [Clostridiales Family XIII bacterium]|nr:hypothetical protein [Clostridiales Family XIII bacterium]
MKRFFIIALVITMTIAFGACGNTEQVDTPIDTTEETPINAEDEDVNENPDLVVYDNFEEYYAAMSAACEALNAAVSNMSTDWTAENAQVVVDAARAVQNIEADIEYDSNYRSVGSDNTFHMATTFFKGAADIIIEAGGGDKMTEKQIDTYYNNLSWGMTGFVDETDSLSYAEAELKMEARSRGIEVPE